MFKHLHSYSSQSVSVDPFVDDDLPSSFLPVIGSVKMKRGSSDWVIELTPLVERKQPLMGSQDDKNE